MPHPEAVGGTRLGAALRGSAALAVLGVVLSLALRATVRDRVPGLSAFFLATPAVLDAAFAAAAAVVAWRLARPRTAILAASLAAVSACLYASGSFAANEPSAPGAIRGVFWNVARGRTPWPGIAAALRRFDPDVVWLAEATGGAALDEALRAEFPGWTIARAGSGLVAMSRGDARFVERQNPAPRSRMALYRMTVDGRAFDVVQADLAADPLASRRATIGRVLAYAEPLLGAPLLVLGDFNTPRDSSAFDSWRGRLTHAFEAAGRGLDATWPSPVPVLSIDHVWAAGGIAIRTCDLPWTRDSDHLPVVFTFDAP